MRNPATKHPLWPTGQKHPMTKEPLIDGDIVVETEVHELRFGPPVPPRRALFDFDENDELVYVRELTDREMSKATAEYEREAAEYAKSNGMMRVPGLRTTRGSFRTESGSTLNGIHDGGKWLWTSMEAIYRLGAGP